MISKIGEKAGAKLPRIYYVNWFRKSEGGDFLWPGYGENSRVLQWIFDRCEGTAKSIETPIGNLPVAGGIDVSGLGVSAEDMAELLEVDLDGWLADVAQIEEYFAKFGDRVPHALRDELAGLKARLEAAKD